MGEPTAPKISPPLKLQTRSESRIASYVISSIQEPPIDDEDGSLTRHITAKGRAASSLAKAKGPASKEPTETADCRRGHSSVAV